MRRPRRLGWLAWPPPVIERPLDAFLDEVNRKALIPVRRALTLHKQQMPENVADLNTALDQYRDAYSLDADRVPR